MNLRIRDYFVRHVLVGDKIIWTVLIMLLAVSAIEVYSASSNMSFKTQDFWGPGLNHVMMILCGLVACSIVAHLNMTFIKICTVAGNLLSFFLLICALFFGEEVNGASRWVFGLQPSEIAKGVLVMTVALTLSLCIDPVTRRVTKKGFHFCLGITFVNCLLIAPENLSTAALTGCVVVMMMFVGRVSLRMLLTYLGPVAAVAIAAFVFMKTTPMPTIKAISETTVLGVQPLHRLTTWAKRLRSDDKHFTAADYPLNERLQVAHAKIAVATSGLWGCGPGNSVQRDYLPQAFSDFIFAIIIEELGLIGGIGVLILYIVLLLQVGNISRRCKERFPQLLAMGLTLLIVTQAMFNIGVAVDVLPVTGQQLPLVSRGGTGIILNSCYIGIILAMSRMVQREEEKEKQLETANEIIKE